MDLAVELMERLLVGGLRDLDTKIIKPDWI